MKYLWLAVPVALLWMCSYDRFPDKLPAARIQIDNFLVALGAYKTDVGDFPSTAEGLHALRANPGRAGWHGPYIPKDIPLDPWGAPYIYRYPGAHGSGPDIVSYGADRLPGGEGISADVVSWRK
jgi:general secretion pathway protein G